MNSSGDHVNLYLLELVAKFEAREVQIRLRTDAKAPQFFAFLERQVFKDILIPKKIKRRRKNKQES
jgi:hypothetical protein